MDDADDGPYAREPQLEDLVRLARALNAHHVRYVLIGGFAVIAHGGARTTKDIDLLIDAAPENVVRVREALQILEDKAVDDVADDDVARYSVVRVADEIVVDLMAGAQGHHSAVRRGRPPVPAGAHRRNGTRVAHGWWGLPPAYNSVSILSA